MSRSERRRHNHGGWGDSKVPVIIAGDGIVGAELGHRFEAKPHAQLPDKVPGEHRWIATAAYVVTVELVESAHDPDTMKYLDHENLMHLAIGCWDCEQPLGEIQPGSRCPAEGTE